MAYMDIQGMAREGLWWALNPWAHDDADFDTSTASIAADTTPPAPMVPRLWEAVASSTPSRDADTIEVTVTSVPVAPTVPPVPPMPIAAAAPTRRARNTSDLVDASIATVPFDDIIERPETVLARMGLPARLVPRGKSGMALRSALVESLAALPEVDPLPAARGVAVAVIGPLSVPPTYPIKFVPAGSAAFTCTPLVVPGVV